MIKVLLGASGGPQHMSKSKGIYYSSQQESISVNRLNDLQKHSPMEGSIVEGSIMEGSIVEEEEEEEMEMTTLPSEDNDPTRLEIINEETLNVKL